MDGADFAYGAPAAGGAGGGLSLSIFADRAHLRADLAEDAAAAGFRLGQVGEMAALLGADDAGAAGPVLGDAVLLDCPDADAECLAALATLDGRAARMGTQLVVSTSMAALDGVFGCLDQSGAQILVEPSRGERVIALGRVIMAGAAGGVRELSEDDRLALLRLTEQVSQIAQRLDRMGSPLGEQAGGARDGVGREGASHHLGSPAVPFRFDHGEAPAGGADAGDRLVRSERPGLPDPRLVRRILRQRQLRARFFDGDLFADPAWDMLLDLTAARAEHARVSVTSLCIASGVPPTTALRWIGQMSEAGLLERVEDETDRRRAFITLTDKAVEAMSRYFAELGAHGDKLI